MFFCDFIAMPIFFPDLIISCSGILEAETNANCTKLSWNWAGQHLHLKSMID